MPIMSPVLSGLCLLLLLVVTCHGQTPSGLKDIHQAPNGDMLLRAEPQVANPDELLLQSSDFPNGPYWTVPGQQRSTVTGGYEFLAPRKNYQSRQFYRLGTFGPGSTLPYIRFIAPGTNVQIGQQVTLHGENFAATPAGNAVTFTLLSGLVSQATVVSASARQLVFTVPNDLEDPLGNPPILYRVTVTTATGTSNGVGCEVGDVFLPAFELVPENAILVLPPGSGTESLVIGGGTPPYTLDPLLPQHATIVSAAMQGNLVNLTATPGSPGGLIGVTVRDSAGREETSIVEVSAAQFTPSFLATFHTILAGAAPGFTLALFQSTNSLSIGQTEITFQGASLEIGHLGIGDIPAFVEVTSPSVTGTRFAHLQISSAEPGTAYFDIVLNGEEGPEVVGSGSLIAKPPAIVIHAKEAHPAIVVPSPNQRILFNNGIVRMPSTVGAPFSMSAVFTSGSTRRDRHLEMQASSVQNFTTTGTSGPRIEYVRPVEAQASAYVKLTGTGMGAGSTVTFTSSTGTVPAVVTEVAADGLTVVVPDGADVAGPIRVTSGGQQSNPHEFWPRFHGDAVLVFDSLQASTPASFRLLFQQLPDTGGTEIRIGKIVWTTDKGSFNFSNLVEFDDVGTISVAGQNDTFENSFAFWYAGEEAAGNGRHVFESAYNRFVLSNAAGGQGVAIELEQTAPTVRIDLAWDCHFTESLFVPPAAGTTVRTRMEMSSRVWRSAAWPPLNIIRNFKQVTQP